MWLLVGGGGPAYGVSNFPWNPIRVSLWSPYHIKICFCFSLLNGFHCVFANLIWKMANASRVLWKLSCPKRGPNVQAEEARLDAGFQDKLSAASEPELSAVQHGLPKTDL